MSDTSLAIVRQIKAAPETVFATLVRPELIARWWGPDDGPVLVSEADARVGGAFRVRFRMLDDSEHESTGVYTEVTPPRRLAMTWRWIGRDDPESLLEFDLRAVDSGTELTLTHSRLPSVAARDDHRWGWSGALDKLERLFAAPVAEDGGLLRDISSSAIVAVSDLARARAFYEGRLGLEIADESTTDVLIFRTGATRLAVYRSAEAGSNRANAVVWGCGDAFDAIVAALERRSVTFEHYPDLEGLTIAGNVHVAGPNRLAWLKDPDGNILHLNNM